MLSNIILYLHPNTSTFHYGSIKIYIDSTIFSDVYKSTFHYGSIKMKELLNALKNLDNLHSTMVLLKLLKYFLLMIYLKDLHSTMVLLKC